MKRFTEEKIRILLESSYEKAINGIAHLDSAIELAKKYQNKKVEYLIRSQILKSGSVLYIQIRMIASIAHIAGYDIKDEKVKSLIFLCLVGNSAVEILKEIGIVVGKQFSINTLKKMSAKGIIHLKQAVIIKILSKIAEKSSFSIVKIIPVIGGLIGGSVDMISTKVIAKTAKQMFIENQKRRD